MAMSSHLKSLKDKHSRLEEELRVALNSPSTTDAEIAEIKRRKLLLKDEISRLETESA